MHDDLKIKYTKPIPKFCQNLFDFENPQNFQQTQKLGHKRWNAWRNEWERVLPEKRIDLETEEHLGKRFGVSERGLGGEKTRSSQERPRKWDLKLRRPYI